MSGDPHPEVAVDSTLLFLGLAKVATMGAIALLGGLVIAVRRFGFARAVARAAIPICALALSACTDDLPPLTGTVQEETFSSSLVNDDYLIQVRLPPGYDPDGSTLYPVVYQLDGTSFGPELEITARHASGLEAQGTIEPVIVVGVGYPYDDPLIDKTRGRARDYVVDSGPDGPGGADTFYSFLEQELIPHIDATYRTDPARRVLSGHSLGGFFSLYAMLKSGDEASPPFAGYIAGDPSLTLDDNRLLREELALRAQTTSLPRTLFLPIARLDGATQQLFFQELIARLEAYDELTLDSEVLDTDHGGAISPGFRDGLAFVLGEGGL